MARHPRPIPAQSARKGKRAPISVPDAAEIAGIIARACGRATPAELLDGPAGLRGVLETYATAFEIKRPPSLRNPAAVVLRRCNAHEPHPDWTAIIEQRIQTIEGWLNEWPSGEPAAPPPHWHQAVQGMRIAIIDAFLEEATRNGNAGAEVELPSDRHLADALQMLLAIVRVNVSSETMRAVMRIQ
ncbi:MAG: hypothetical protein J0H14_07230 [Alphaproteobacteria bacterium]|nr:hypothetical protein [Alphaproteobacteria bacterium]